MKFMKITAILLSAVTMLSLLPAFSLTASAEVSNEKNITLKTAALEKDDFFYFGLYNNSPLKWRILSKNGNGGTYKAKNGEAVFPSNAMLLLSEYALSQMPYDNDGNTNNAEQAHVSDWHYSDVWQWCNAFASNASFLNIEKNSFLKTSKAGSKNTYTDELTEDTFFLLSEDEYNTFATNASEAKLNDEIVWWWLRTPANDTTIRSVGVPSGVYGISYEAEDNAVRPAFNLNQAAVLFTSAAENGKTEKIGTLLKNEESTTNEYKPTILDESRTFAVAKNALPSKATKGETFTLTFSGAVANTNEHSGEYISAMILNDNDEVLYYGHLTKAESASGTVKLTIPYNINYGTYKINIFNEQINDDFKTDFSSAFDEFEITVIPEKNITLGANALLKDEFVYYGTYNSTPIKWHILETNYANSVAFDINDNEVASEDSMFLLSEYALKEMPYNEQLKSEQIYKSDWHYSDAWSWCNSIFAENSFTSTEKNYLLKVGTASSTLYYTSEELDKDLCFFLSVNEFETFATNAMTTTLNGSPAKWWLRTPNNKGNFWYGATTVLENGTFGGSDGETAGIAARPACNLNQSSILFTSAVKGSNAPASTTGEAAIVKNADYMVSGEEKCEYKLTMVDKTRSFALIESTASGTRGEKLTFHYTGAKTNNESCDNEYISAFILNDNNDILYYCRLEKAENARGPVEFTIPLDIDYGTYKVELFNEQVNDGNNANFASDFNELTELSLTVTNPTHVICTKNENGSFSVKAEDVCIGKTVILAFYSGGKLVDCKTETYNGTNDINHMPTVSYDTVKVMVWEDFNNLKPAFQLTNKE